MLTEKENPDAYEPITSIGSGNAHCSIFKALRCFGAINQSDGIKTDLLHVISSIKSHFFECFLLVEMGCFAKYEFSFLVCFSMSTQV